MSNWTHVAGIVRLHNMTLAMVSPAKLASYNVMREIHGQESYNPAKEFVEEVLEIFNKDVPTGSEGPLKIALYVWPTSEDFRVAGGTTHHHKGGIYWADIIVSGDLRDYDEPEYIAEWMKERCKDLPDGVNVRDGTLLAYSERGKTAMMMNDGSGWLSAQKMPMAERFE